MKTRAPGRYCAMMAIIVAEIAIGIAVVARLDAAETEDSEALSPPVIMLTASVPLKIRNEIVGTGSWGDIFIVARREGDWLWVRPATKFLQHQPPGWVPSSATAPSGQISEIIARAIEANPANHAAYAARAALAMRSAKGKSDYDFAVSEINRAIELAPQKLLYRVQRAQIYESDGQLDEALADCHAALAEVDPKNWTA